MGAFHEGHLSLMRLARRKADRVVVSVFVNPTQFGPGEDFTAYPRDLRRDARLARGEGVDLCFAPSAEALYGPNHRMEVHPRILEDVLEGKTRPGHFAGVCLIVLKLLHIVEPDVLVLGQKDAQQAVILETMVRDLDLPVRVVRGATVRDPDGLALSSRNAYLDPGQRAAAPVLYRGLRRAQERARKGERSAARLLGGIRADLAREPRVRLDYAAAVDAVTLEPLRVLAGRVLFCLAAYLGKTRLIDNVQFTLRKRSSP